MAASQRQLLPRLVLLVMLALVSAPARAEVPARGWLTWMSNREAGRHEIYLMEVRQGTGDAEAAPARRLTFSGGDFPVWSPDGRWIAFYRTHSDSGHVIRRDGSGEKKICDGTPHFWVSDHRGVVCGKDATSGDNGAFYLLDPDSGASTLLFSRDDFQHLRGQSMQPGGITADGRWLAAWAFGRFKGGYTADNGTFDSQHSTVLLDLDDRSRIYYFGPGCLSTVAPQGDLVYHVSRAIVATMPDIIKMSVKDVATRASYELELGNADDQWGHEYFPRISTDGRWLAYGASTGCHHWWDCDYEIFVHRLGAGPTARQRLTFHKQNDTYPSLFVGALPAVPPVAPDGGAAGATREGGAGCAVSGGPRGARAPAGPLALALLLWVARRRAR